MANKTKRYRPKRVLATLTVVILLLALSLGVGMFRKKTDGIPDLALDLEGGTQLILTPKAEKGAARATVTQEDLDQAISIIRQRVDASGVAEAEITSAGGQNIMVSLPGQPSEETLDLVRSSAQLDFRPVIQIGAPRAISAADVKKDSPEGKAAEQAKGDPKALAMQLADTNHDGKLSEELAGKPANNSDQAYVSEKVLFDFLTMDCKKKENRQGGSAGDPKKPLVACAQDGTQKYILGPVDVPGTDIAQADSGMQHTQNGGSTGVWEVALQFNREGTDKFAEVSKRLIGFQQSDPARNAFAIVLDGLVVSAPRMQATINDGRASITGSFTQASSAALANQLKFGSLPLNFEVQSEQRISPTLGTDQLRWGIIAGIIGLALIALYLLWQYRGLGMLAIGSLLVAALLVYLTIAVLSWGMGYRLSLAGVAGLIVSIGVTADSFIVYFERIRDEVREGRPLAGAVEEGWRRAKQTILASDAINLLAALVLYMLAVGGVQGFAFTLGVTTVIDLLVVFWFTHPMMALLIRVPFFGDGHRWSGLDPEHLGATRATYTRTRPVGRRRVQKKAPQAVESTETTVEGEAK
ncbi:MAG: protein translocase subunit SecD [Actinomycetaceae bacterium]|nr:protein translocase subunit SecD [Actinomycetaceae bacterium]